MNKINRLSKYLLCFFSMIGVLSYKDVADKGKDIQDNLKKAFDYKVIDERSSGDVEKYNHLLEINEYEKENNNKKEYANILGKIASNDFLSQPIVFDGYNGALHKEDKVDFYYFPIAYDSNITISLYGPSYMNDIDISIFDENLFLIDTKETEYELSTSNTHNIAKYKNTGVNGYLIKVEYGFSYEISYAMEVEVEANNLENIYLNQLRYEENALGAFQKVKLNNNLNLELIDFLTPSKYFDFDAGNSFLIDCLKILDSFDGEPVSHSYLSSCIEELEKSDYGQITFPYAKLYIWDSSIKKFISFLAELIVIKAADPNYELTKEDAFYVLRNMPFLTENLDSENDFLRIVNNAEISMANNSGIDFIEVLTTVGEYCFNFVPYAGQFYGLGKFICSLFDLVKESKKTNANDFGLEPTPGSFVRDLHDLAIFSNDDIIEIDFNYVLKKVDNRTLTVKAKMLPVIPHHKIGDFSGQYDTLKRIPRAESLIPIANNINGLQADIKKITLKNYHNIFDLNFDNSDQTHVDNTKNIINSAELTYLDVDDDVYTYNQFESKWYKFVAPIDGEYVFTTSPGNLNKTEFLLSSFDVFKLDGEELIEKGHGRSCADLSSITTLHFNKNDNLYIKTYLNNKYEDGYKFKLKIEYFGNIFSNLNYSKALNFNDEISSTDVCEFEILKNRCLIAGYSFVSPATYIAKLELLDFDKTALIYVEGPNEKGNDVQLGRNEENCTYDLKLIKGLKYKLMILCENVDSLDICFSVKIRLSSMYGEAIDYFYAGRILPDGSPFSTGSSLLSFSSHSFTNCLNVEYKNIAHDSHKLIMGYPGEPSNEITETISKFEICFLNPISSCYVEFQRYLFNSEIYSQDLFLKISIKKDKTWEQRQIYSMNTFSKINLVYEEKFDWTQGNINGFKIELYRSFASPKHKIKSLLSDPLIKSNNDYEIHGVLDDAPIEFPILEDENEASTAVFNPTNRIYLHNMHFGYICPIESC